MRLERLRCITACAGLTGLCRTAHPCRTHYMTQCDKCGGDGTDKGIAKTPCSDPLGTLSSACLGESGFSQQLGVWGPTYRVSSQICCFPWFRSSYFWRTLSLSHLTSVPRFLADSSLLPRCVWCSGCRHAQQAVGNNLSRFPFPCAAEMPQMPECYGLWGMCLSPGVNTSFPMLCLGKLPKGE